MVDALATMVQVVHTNYVRTAHVDVRTCVVHDAPLSAAASVLPALPRATSERWLHEQPEQQPGQPVSRVCTQLSAPPVAVPRPPPAPAVAAPALRPCVPGGHVCVRACGRCRLYSFSTLGHARVHCADTRRGVVDCCHGASKKAPVAVRSPTCAHAEPRQPRLTHRPAL